jgi:hypothetical protein
LSKEMVEEEERTMGQIGRGGDVGGGGSGRYKEEG